MTDWQNALTDLSMVLVRLTDKAKTETDQEKLEAYRHAALLAETTRYNLQVMLRCCRDLEVNVLD